MKGRSAKRLRKKRNTGADDILKGPMWSYEVGSIDPEKDKKIIIERILNHGSDAEVIWLLRTYRKEEIISVLKNPSRGVWDEKSLNFWLSVFNVKIGRRNYERALRKIYVETGSR